MSRRVACTTFCLTLATATLLAVPASAAVTTIHANVQVNVNSRGIISTPGPYYGFYLAEAKARPAVQAMVHGTPVTLNPRGIISAGPYQGLYLAQAQRGPVRTARRVAAASTKADAVANFARAQVGERYVWGATGPSSWDCSGLVQAAFRHAGVALPRVSHQQARAGTRVPLSQVRKGDIVVYRGHVAIAVGGGMQVAASNPRGGVKLQPIYRGALYGVRVI